MACRLPTLKHKRYHGRTMHGESLDSDDSLGGQTLAYERDYTTDSLPPTPPPDKPKFAARKLLLPLLALLITLVVIGGVATLLLKKPAKPAVPITPITINTQSLDNGTLTKLTAQAAPNDTKQQLTVTPDALFKNNVQVQGILTANKDLNVGGNLNVNGTTTLQNAVAINSSAAIRGALSVGGALSAGSLNVGSLVVTTVNASGNINFGGHLLPGGATPNAVASTSAAGGSVSVSGNDTAGTITITMGNGTLVAGEFAIINFRTRFATTPKVQLTPVNSPASALNYFATRSAGFFTVNTSSPPAASTSYVFDYLVTQ